MGTLSYGNGTTSGQFEDRALAHLQLVISAKFRRGERFLFSWQHGQDSGGGRSSIWLDPSIPLHFEFTRAAAAAGQVNRQWLDQLMQSANSVGGLHLLDEQPEAGLAPARSSRGSGAVPAR